MNASSIISALAELPVPDVRYFEVTGSTNSEALTWIAQGAEDGCLVVADQQTQGRGRLGRRWITNPGAALAFSLILHPTPAEKTRMSFFSALGALAICQVLEKTLDLSPQIKWPNDVLLEGKKMAGILVESGWIGDRLQGLVIGVGINIGAEAVPPASELLFPATSIEAITAKPIDRLEVLRAILQEIFLWRDTINSADFHAAWDHRLAFKGEWVKIEETAAPASASTITGQLVGLDDTGSLIIRTSAGINMQIAVGDVHLRPIE